MWRLRHWLFGWHYALVITTMFDDQIIRRVRKDASGRMYVEQYGERILFLEDNLKTDKGYPWTPLTWRIDVEWVEFKG